MTRKRQIRDRLGPDPLRADGTADEFVRLLSRRTIPLGAALLDQGVLAGVGNIFRAEALFVAAIDPLRSAASVPPADRLTALWETIRTLMRDGVRLGRIVTRDPVELGLRSRRSIRIARRALRVQAPDVPPLRGHDRRGGRRWALALLVPELSVVRRAGGSEALEKEPG